MLPVALLCHSGGLEMTEERFLTCRVYADVAGDAMSRYSQADGWLWCCGCWP